MPPAGVQDAASEGRPVAMQSIELNLIWHAQWLVGRPERTFALDG